MKKTIFSLALGTFGLGMAEFGIMGVLPEIAHDVGVSIPVAGNMIAWYAFGVVIGAPVMVSRGALYCREYLVYLFFQLFHAGDRAAGVRLPAWRLFRRRGDYSVEGGAAG